MMRHLLLLISLSALPLVSSADPGHPVAIRHTSSGGFEMETMWNLLVRIDDEPASSELEGVDIVLGDSSTREENKRFRATVPSDNVLDRLPNEAHASWRKFSSDLKLSTNAIRVQVIDDANVIVTVDGLQIGYHRLAADDAAVPEEMKTRMGACDVMILDGEPTNAPASRDAQHAVLMGKQLTVLSAKSIADADRQENLPNTCVANSDFKPKQSVIAMLTTKPTELSQAVADLIDRKEKACRESQAVFAKLTTNQMNFRPSNGTHTPRWNTEHMMGRELLFFSQIYASREPKIPVMDLNPKQMPPDYVAKHKDWTGAEEARQMERVSAFTRRFAYLLNDLPLDKQAPGSRWTLRGLLRQMDRHYTEHTTNTQKKFELPDWPAE